MIVYLWDAPGTDRSGCGVSDDQGRARLAAEKMLRSGQAHAARVEAAYAMLGMGMLESGYRRTGLGWQARHGDRGGITWEPLAAVGAEKQAVSRSLRVTARTEQGRNRAGAL